MRTGGSASRACEQSGGHRPFAHEARDPSTRQLRLVEEHYAAGGPVGGESGNPETGESAYGAGSAPPARSEGLAEGVVSLADYVLGLAVGSPCFCCGEPLGVGGGPDGACRDGSEIGLLECRSCGASLEGPTSR